MRRLVLLCGLLLGLPLSLVHAASASRPPSPYGPPAPHYSPPPHHPPTGYHSPLGWPKGLAIPRLAIHATIDADPLVKSKPIDQQPPWEEVLWFSRGAKPGEPGRAFLVGHLDSTCCPAIFWNLHQLTPQDEIRIFYRKGMLTFRVIWLHSYPDNAIPYRWMYFHHRNDQRSLVLMTCSGLWHGPALGYDHRLIVFARLVLPGGRLG
jgi:hypothetical protein